MDKFYKGIKARVARVIYFSPKTKWGVLAVTNTIKDQLFNELTVSLVGNFDGVYEDCEIEFDGHFIVSPKYGNQIEINRLKVLQDLSSAESVINFLAKSNISGISTQNARKIWQTFGKDSINVVLNQPEKLTVIYGIGDGTFERVKDSIETYKRMQALLEYGCGLGIPYQLLYKLDQELGERALDVLKENVYKVVELCEAFSFKQLDTIGQKIGVPPTDIHRLRACLVDKLRNKIMLESSTGCTSADLKVAFAKASGLAELNYYQAALNVLRREGVVILEGSYVYYKPYYDREQFISMVIKDLMQVPLRPDSIPDPMALTDAMGCFEFTLNDQQVSAIESIVEQRVAVLTGGPGTGKSTITKALVNAFKSTRTPFNLLTPTGKATRRLQECAEAPAQTIHKYLGVRKSLDDVDLSEFMVTPDTVYIIDESSMVDINMLYKLAEIARMSPIRFLFVGDKDQLPSVQAGNVLGDMIESGVIPVYTLTDIMRQSKDSHIIKYCADINKGISFRTCNEDDFIYQIYEDDSDLINDLLDNYEMEVEKYGLSNVQVIAPYKEGVLGIKSLNIELSNYVNQNNINETFGFKVGDKVMQLVNDYKKDVFNGETGVVDSFSGDLMYVSFNDVLIPYEANEVSNLSMAYASTCHKSQGAEYPVVFVVLEDKYGGMLLTRKLLYTGVSRGKKKVYLYSMGKSAEYCISNTNETPRITKLKSFLCS